jgi:hypothetical protein
VNPKHLIPVGALYLVFALLVTWLQRS